MRDVVGQSIKEISLEQKHRVQNEYVETEALLFSRQGGTPSSTTDSKMNESITQTRLYAVRGANGRWALILLVSGGAVL